VPTCPLAGDATACTEMGMTVLKAEFPGIPRRWKQMFRDSCGMEIAKRDPLGNEGASYYNAAVAASTAAKKTVSNFFQITFPRQRRVEHQSIECGSTHDGDEKNVAGTDGDEDEPLQSGVTQLPPLFFRTMSTTQAQRRTGFRSAQTVQPNAPQIQATCESTIQLYRQRHL